jgi:hypothetical protein
LTRTGLLRLAAGQPATLQVDFGDDGSADKSFDRAAVTKIDVDLLNGDDQFRIDQVTRLRARHRPASASPSTQPALGSHSQGDLQGAGGRVRGNDLAGIALPDDRRTVAVAAAAEPALEQLGVLVIWVDHRESGSVELPTIVR